MLLENCNAEEDGKTKYTYDDANDKQLLKPIKNSVRWWCDGDDDDGGVDDNGGNGEIKKEDDEGNKDESILKNSFRYYAIARPLQYHMVITGGSFPLPA